MPSPLEKARQAPDSMKGRILSAARKLYGEYGFHGVTARMIATEVGIDVSTLYYHWGDKQDLYEAVLTDLNEEIRQKLAEIEKIVRGKPIDVRLAVAIDVMCDHLFQNPETSNLMLFSFFSKTRTQSDLDTRMTEHLANIAVAMGLALAGIFLIFGSFRLSDIVAGQGDLIWGWLPKWGVVVQPLGFLLFIAAVFAETNRAPFNVAEGESEIVAGHMTEFSVMKFALFFMGEYISIFFDASRGHTAPVEPCGPQRR